MPRLVESLRAENGVFENLTPHIERMILSRKTLFSISTPPELEEALSALVPPPGKGVWKIRVIYDTRIHAVECAPYKAIPYRSAALVDGNQIEYRFKTLQRPHLDALNRRAQAAGADTALIVRNGLITDFTWANAVFFDGTSWFTPASALLEGTRRRRLLQAGRIIPADIRANELSRFSLAGPINAMLDLGEITMDISNIIPEEISTREEPF